MIARSLAIVVGLGFLISGPSARGDNANLGIAGSWDSTWGFITFQTAPVQGKKVLAVTGSYISGKGRNGVVKSGTFDPATGVLEFVYNEPWRNPSQGSARFKRAADGKHFKGSYQHGNERGDWSLTRVPGRTFADRMGSIVANAGIRADTPGAAVLVIEGGKVVFEKGYGLAHLNDKKPITPRTTFELASCSKHFAGAAVLRLFEQGKLGLEDDVRKYLPELPQYDKKNPIRILHLARHSSGLPEYMNFPNVKGKNPKFLANEDFVHEFARQRKKFPLYFPTGAESRYTNTNYMLLALIVERISKKSFGAILKSEFFDPLGMKTARVYENPRVRVPEPALGYSKDKNRLKITWGAPPLRQETLLAVGDGGVWVSLEDMIRWDAGWRQNKVLKPATVKRALVPSKTRDGKSNDYAFGWHLSLDNGKLVRLSHTGAWGGFRTLVDRDLAADRTIIVLGNLDNLDPGAIGTPVEHLCWTIPPR
jgi:CubicO group peptidase (beta-lactamase class C family)